MNLMNRYYPESRFGNFTDVDGTIHFYSRVNELIAPGACVVDVGCGRGAYMDDPVRVRRELRILKGKCKRVIGIDVDQDAAQNPFLDEFRFLTGNKFPVEDNSADLVVCDNVLEHLSDPEMFFSELGRVLKKGGHACIRTPNLLSYFGLSSILIPNRFHSRVVPKLQNNTREEKDVFPTLYKCNTKMALRGMFSKHGFDACVYGYEAEPQYFAFSRILYFLGALHQRFAPDVFKITLFGFGQKVR